MPERFFDYWQQERGRIEQELQRAQLQGEDHYEATWLNRLRHIVDDQFDRWSHDLTTDQMTARH
jgi:hypothetical protein